LSDRLVSAVRKTQLEFLIRATDGAIASSALIYANGAICGVTLDGGANDVGTF
jgi:hypothetical protein